MTIKKYYPLAYLTRYGPATPSVFIGFEIICTLDPDEFCRIITLKDFDLIESIKKILSQINHTKP